MHQSTGIDFKNLFESAPGLYLILNPDLTIVAVSENYLRATMTSRENIIGRALFEVFPDNPDDPSATGVSNLRTSLMLVLQNKAAHTMAVQKYDIRRPDGSFEERHWSPLNTPVMNDANEVLWIIHRVEDVTEIVKLKENEIKQENELRRTNELLVHLNKELESFTYSVSHDLRSPLRIIDGYADILVSDYKKDLDEDGQRYLDVIRANARRMGQLIDDLLNLSYIGRKELAVHPTDMNKLIHSIIDEQFALENIRPKLSIEHLLPATCDSGLLRQVWINLLSNAVKYSGKVPSPMIKIGSFQKDGMVVYFVKDNGVGFDMKYSDKLFGIFQRLHKVTEFEGTGIGLALVKRILTKHGGDIRVEAEPDKGATFYFSLPII
ncbi:MAG TPA: ATP-binding protein [Chitinophagaceae bacterium]